MRTILYVLTALVGTNHAAAEEFPTVAAGYTVEKVAGAPLVRHPMMANFDDRGRLFIAESAGLNLRSDDLLKETPNFIRMLVDEDQDGTFDKSTIFADQMTLPQGSLWYRGALYVASPPNIWRLEDTDDDGVADKRDVLVDKFGFNGNAASIHGCFLGPTGRIYWCDGRHGHEFTDEKGNIVSQGKAARIFSCRLDGTDVRAWCGGGMDNPVEVDFTPEGEMIGSVNLFYGRPRGDCLVHWVEGGVYPRRDQQACIDEFVRTGDLISEFKNFGHVAVSGMLRRRSASTGELQILTTMFNTGELIRSRLTRSGSSFTSMEDTLLASESDDFHPTDVVEDADGSLLVIDTGGWFRIGCPTSQIAKPEVAGGIYRIRKTNTKPVADPRGVSIAFRELPADQLVQLLDDDRFAVRERAIDSLAQRGVKAIEPLRTVLTYAGDGSIRHRRNAVWATSRMNVPGATGLLLAAMEDDSDSVRLAALRAISEMSRRSNDPDTALSLVKQLISEPNVAVQRAIADAIQWPSIRTPDNSQQISAISRQATHELFRKVRADDRILEHSLVSALNRILRIDPDSAQEVASYLKSTDPNKQRVALLVLNKLLPPDGQLLSLLDTSNRALQAEALRVIETHPDTSRLIRDRIMEWLQEESPSIQRIGSLQGLLERQIADSSIQQLIGESVSNPKVQPQTRRMLFEVMRSVSASKPGDQWKTAIEFGLKNSIPDAIRTAAHFDLRDYDSHLTTIAKQTRAGFELRTEAVRALAPRLQQTPDDWFELLVGQLNDAQPLRSLRISDTIALLPLNSKQLIAVAEYLPKTGPLIQPVLFRAFGNSTDEAVGKAVVHMAQQPQVTIGSSELRRTLQNFPESIQSMIADVTDKDRETREAILVKMAERVNGGDPVAGQKVFRTGRIACTTCHSVKGDGGQVGPDLTKIGAIRNGRDLLEAIIFPSASFARGYRSYSVVTDSGKVHSGLIERQSSNELVLKTRDLKQLRIATSEIDELIESPVSIMPKGLETVLTEHELRDLLAYLQQLK